jgi:hypothetical protein
MGGPMKSLIKGVRGEKSWNTLSYMNGHLGSNKLTYSLVSCVLVFAEPCTLIANNVYVLPLQLSGRRFTGPLLLCALVSGVLQISYNHEFKKRICFPNSST